MQAGSILPGAYARLWIQAPAPRPHAPRFGRSSTDAAPMQPDMPSDIPFALHIEDQEGHECFRLDDAREALNPPVCVVLPPATYHVIVHGSAVRRGYTLALAAGETVRLQLPRWPPASLSWRPPAPAALRGVAVFEACKGVLALALAAVCGYALLRFSEAWGLWRGRAWGEWVGMAAGAVYLTIEVRHLVHQPTALVAAVFAVNLGLVGSLAWRLWRRRRGPPAGRAT